MLGDPSLTHKVACLCKVHLPHGKAAVTRLLVAEAVDDAA